MALTKYNGAINTIQSLSDKPNQTDGLTAAQLKVKFDQAAIDNQTYLDDTLTVEVDTKFTTIEADGFVTTARLATNAVTTTKILDANVTGVKLENSGVVASTYKSVTVDAKGRVTNGTNPTTLSDYGITDAVSNTSTETIAGVKTFSSSPVVPTATANGEVINKGQMDSAITSVILGDITPLLDTDGTLTAESDVKIATQKAVKTYADTKQLKQIPDDTTPANKYEFGVNNGLLYIRAVV